MNNYFLACAALIVLSGAIHSGLGETLILSRLETDRLPTTPFGGQRMTFQLLRGTWHLLTLVWLVLAAALVFFASSPSDPRGVGIAQLVVVLFAMMGLGIFANNPRMLLRHPACLLFLSIACLAWCGCR